MTVPPDINNLAKEALDLWQEHLVALASDPKAKADLAQLIEPSRRLFAEWVEKAQNANYASAPVFATAAKSAEPPSTHGAASAGAASDDGSLRLSQLALHVAELEKRVARLEARKPRAARKAASDPERSE